MPVNRNKPDRWKADIAQSVDLYNSWFMEFAPKAFRDTRVETTRQVEAALSWTHNLKNVSPDVLRAHPDVLQMLRMSTCPPIARDRLIGLSGALPTVVKSMELKDSLPPRMSPARLQNNLEKITGTIQKLIDPDIFVWLTRKENPEVA
jgi:hypothetical protein